MACIPGNMNLSRSCTQSKGEHPSKSPKTRTKIEKLPSQYEKKSREFWGVGWTLAAFFLQLQSFLH